MRVNDAAEIADFTRMVAAHLQYRVLVAFFQATKRERQPQQIIVVLPASKSGKAAGKNRCNGLLGTRLTCAAGHGNDNRMPPLQNKARILLQGYTGICYSDGCDPCLLQY